MNKQQRQRLHWKHKLVPELVLRRSAGRGTDGAATLCGGRVSGLRWRQHHRPVRSAWCRRRALCCRRIRGRRLGLHTTADVVARRRARPRCRRRLARHLRRDPRGPRPALAAPPTWPLATRGPEIPRSAHVAQGGPRLRPSACHSRLRGRGRGHRATRGSSPPAQSASMIHGRHCRSRSWHKVSRLRHGHGNAVAHPKLMIPRGCGMIGPGIGVA